MRKDCHSTGDMLLFILVMAAGNGICSIAAGIMMYPAFTYIAQMVKITAPGFWASIGLVFVIRQVAMLVSQVHLFGSRQ